MLAGTIAVITAVLVTNVNIEPVFILWILPTIIISPLIFFAKLIAIFDFPEAVGPAIRMILDLWSILF